MDEYAYQEKGIEDMLKRERQKQENKLQDMLEKWKWDKLANLESDKWNKIDDTQNQIKNKSFMFMHVNKNKRAFIMDATFML